MALRLPYTFDSKDIPDGENLDMFFCRWLNPDDYDWVYVLYKKQPAIKGLFGCRERFIAIGVEYVASHWGIQLATTGMCDYVRIFEKTHPCQFLKLDHNMATSKIKYDMETHVIKKWSLSFERNVLVKLHRFSDYKPHETN